MKFIPFSTNAGARARAMLAAGEAQMAHGDASHPLQLNGKGKKAKILLATQMVGSISNIVIRTDLYAAGIDTVAKLAAYKRPDGAKPIVAVTSIGSGTWMFGTYVFQSKGFGDKVNYVPGGGTKTMLGGLETKQFDVIMAPPAWQLEAENRGIGKSLYDVRKAGVWERDFGGTMPVLVIYTLDDVIEQKPQLVQSTINALYKAMRWMKASSTDDIYALVGEKYYGTNDPAAIKVELGFDKDSWAYTGTVTKEDFDRAGKVWYRNGTGIPPTKYEDVVDMSFLQKAQKKYG
jgi:NitT/TauT family transport system substrate-binding protein